MGGESGFSEETWASWLDPFHATRLLLQAGLEDRESAVDWLKGRLRSGELRAAGWHLRLDPDDPLMKASEMVVGRYKSSTWHSIAAIPWKDDFWVSGDYQPDDPLDAFRRRSERDEFTHYLTKVRFEPTLIEQFCRAAARPVGGDIKPKALRARSVGGRPPKPVWDDLWSHIAAALYTGDLKPARQSDIEKAMHEWLASHAEELGETTIRRAARKLWQAIQQEGQN